MLRQIGTPGAEEVALGMEVALLLVLGVKAFHRGLRPQRSLPGRVLDPPCVVETGPRTSGRSVTVMPLPDQRALAAQPGKVTSSRTSRTDAATCVATWPPCDGQK